MYLLLIGLELARLADLPNDALEEAWRVSKKMEDFDSKRELTSAANNLVTRRTIMLRVITLVPIRHITFLTCLLPGSLSLWNMLSFVSNQLRTQLTQALEHSTLSNTDLRTYLARLQKESAEAIRNTLVGEAGTGTK